jgi:hypothetical protein
LSTVKAARNTGAFDGAPAARARLEAVAAGDAGVRGLIGRLWSISVRGLPLMYRDDERQFAFTRRRAQDGTRLEGVSPRYGAIVLLGSQGLVESEQRSLFAGATAVEFCERMIGEESRPRNLGDAALLAWAAAELGAPSRAKALEVMRRLRATDSTNYTVDAAWELSGLVAAGERDAAKAAADVLLAVSSDSGIFPHHTRSAGFWRSHVGCFADQVYPIQALARYGAFAKDKRALGAAQRCADRICELQGPGGQWWWHYDARTGRVIEGYPVYSVHQNSMAPMALLDLADAGGTLHREAMVRGLRWLENAPEIGMTLIDDGQSLIWRKAARADPAKLVRRARACVSRLHPSLRLGVLDSVFPPTRIDFESRPYHLGWILYAWTDRPKA